jgi:hypothetical protein
MNIHKYTLDMLKTNGGRISTFDLTRLVRELDPERWTGYSDLSLARIISNSLRPHGIEPKNIRIGKRVAKGYSNRETLITDL